jgi:hypothetical protein
MDRRKAQVPADVQSLDSMSRRLRDGDSPSRQKIEQTLERGFAKLMQLEAELQNGRKAAASKGDPPPSAADLDDVEEAIATLREALTVLRNLSSPPGPPRVGYGFVLPRDPAPQPWDGDG